MSDFLKRNKDYNEIFKDFNIIYHTPKNILTNHGENWITSILQLQDGRLASCGLMVQFLYIINKHLFQN